MAKAQLLAALLLCNLSSLNVLGQQESAAGASLLSKGYSVLQFNAECNPSINTSFTPTLLGTQTVQFLPDSLHPYLNYYWEFGDGYSSYSINPVHTYWNNGLFEVCLTVSDTGLECSTKHCTEMELNTTGIGAMSATTEKAKVYPNPTSKALHIAHSSKTSQWTAIVYGLRGEKIWEKTGNASETTVFEMEFWPKGLYFLVIQTNEGVQSERIIKSK